MLDALDEAEREVSQRREAEQRLNERMRRQESEAALGRFSAGVAHELGAPLTVIQTDVRRLGQAMPGDEAQRRLERISRQLERTRQLVEQLMGLVRDSPPRFESLVLGEAVRRAVQGVRPEAEARRIELEVHAGKRITLPGLAVRVEHAVLNLLRNAVQAAAAKVCLKVEQRGEVAVISVEDDGPGMDPERRNEVFEPFETDRPSGKGMGLGLTIVRAVAEVHGGRVRAAAGERLGGCRFEMLLPLEGGRAEGHRGTCEDDDHD